MKITFLGTGSAVPTKKRNHTAILVETKNTNILVDCGEGTQRQFRQADINPGKLTHLLITHWHGDHTYGIPGLLETLSMGEYSKTLHIYGPKGTKRAIESHEKIFGRFHLKLNIKETSKKVFENSEILIEALPMKHTQKTPCNAYSITIKDKLRLDKKKLAKLKLPNSPLIGKLQEGKNIKHPKTKKLIKAKDLVFLEKGKKVTIVLDTLPNANIIKLAKNSDILICESSFTEKEKVKAHRYKHMTASDAAKAGKKAKVKKLILTHISRRYEKDSSPVLKEAKKTFKNTSIPKDFDIFTL